MFDAQTSRRLFKTPLDINLSTRFTDWIDPKLLQVKPDDLVRIRLQSQRFEEVEVDGTTQYRVHGGKRSELKLDPASGAWSITGLTADDGSVSQSKLQAIVNSFADLQILNVRPKFKFNSQQILTADLKLLLPTDQQQRDQALVQVGPRVEKRKVLF